MTLHFTWNGKPLTGQPGDSIAAALSEAGVRTFGTSRAGRARGLFCGMGACQECLVVVDGTRSRRACMTELRQDMAVETQDDRAGTPSADTSPVAATDEISVDLAVLGGGPAGLNAAIAARRAGFRVLVIDERTEAGGQYFKPRSKGFRGKNPPDGQHRRGSALCRRALASGAEFRWGETVWFARRSSDGFDMRSVGPAACARIMARTVILCTGALERPTIVPGWTVPGVMTIGAAQTLIRRYGIRPGGRVLVAGHGPLGMQLGAELVRIGGEVAAVVERAALRPNAALLRAAIAGPALARDGLGYRLALMRSGAPFLAGWEVASVLGSAKVEGARLRCLADGRTREVAADLLCLGEGFAPQAELARLFGVPLTLDPETGLALPQRAADGATAVPGLWIAGDAGGLGGAALAESQGEHAGKSAAAYLGKSVPPAPSAGTDVSRAVRFQNALWDFYRAPPRALPGDGVEICRCEEVRAGTVRAAVAEGAHDPGAVKRATRLGMGRCQGRYCTAPLIRILAEAGHRPGPESLFAPQIPARPVPIAHLAVEKPEWGGHRDCSPGARPAASVCAPIATRNMDLVVIGAGITGISAALFAARQGASVLCLDRGRINGEASGGNAGSLHLQLLSWDFGAKAVAGGSPQLWTLPLQQESIKLWHELEDELGGDFEIDVTGGLMVAENEAQVEFLEAKAAAEAQVGIRTEVIGAACIRRIAPAISDQIIAAGWCQGEGKINPLVATSALARAAMDAGVRIEELAAVTGLRGEADGYEIQTSRGRVSARRVLIAAGGWSAEIASLLGVMLPIRGAPIQMVVTDAAPPLFPCLIAHADRHLTMKQTRAGTVLIGGAWPAETDTAGQPHVLPESLEGNVWVAARTVPALSGMSVIRSWAAMNIDIDGAPLIGGVPGCSGITIAAAANGYTLGPLMGREAASVALTGLLRRDLQRFSMDRFSQE